MTSKLAFDLVVLIVGGLAVIVAFYSFSTWSVNRALADRAARRRRQLHDLCIYHECRVCLDNIRERFKHANTEAMRAVLRRDEAAQRELMIKARDAILERTQ